MQFEEFLSVVDLLKDTTKYEAKIAELQARDKAIQDSIAQLNVASDIVKAKKQIDILNARAQSAVEAAEVQAASIVAGAQAAYEKKFAALQEKEVVADQALANYNTIRNQQASRENELRTQEKAVETLREILQAQQAQLTKSQAEVDERLSKLRQVMG